MPAWLSQLLPIVILLGVITFIVSRLPKVDIGHSDAFMARRRMNWLPLGLSYAFLYMGRYNLTVSKNALGDLMTIADFSQIFLVGTVTYGFSFLINGPLTDRLGGRTTMLFATAGSAVANLLMGVATWDLLTGSLGILQKGPSVAIFFSLLYALNMYFQSFGAVSIVKVNAAWFHVRERGVFGGIFGILISLGVYFAYDWGRLIVNNAPTIAPDSEQKAVWWVFFIPAALLLTFCLATFLWVRDTPGDAGHRDFDTGDASSGDDGPRLGVFEVAKKMLSNPIILTIAAIEFCSGFLRQAIMQYGYIFAKQTGHMADFAFANWGMMLCVAGILGGMFAGVISDRLFQSRRGPVSAILYGGMVVGALALLGALNMTVALVGWIVVGMSLCIIGVHGMLSGTASMDFGGKKNVGVAVGIIDGLVYLGSGAQAGVYGALLPKGDAAKIVDNWMVWPIVMLPVAVIGLFLASRLWNARPKGAGGH
ncbi:MAG: MFS transporter [Deltaproteobacteria bacterium]|nr:MFS transporter [Deltaproteobacteria bacterium]